MRVLNLGKAFHDELTGKIMVVMLFLLSTVAAFVLFLQLYAKWYLRHRSFASSSYAESSSISTVRLGLDPTALDSIPVLTFSPEEKGGMECAVCLSDVLEGEKVRILRKCEHGFHVDCIDMWFHSHQTCPLCRIVVSNSDYSSQKNTLDSLLQPNTTHTQQDVRSDDDHVVEAELVNRATTTLLSSSVTVAIDMPRQAVVEETSEEQATARVVTVRLNNLPLHKYNYPTMTPFLFL